ncbi:glycosyltransferase family 8 protein [Hymenobacter endophyticus]|uniref:Glycosyltransferase family 8 protein n=1 Tax=Hymenobacter endophyticus TaxID=3076335 RepID=A0ABU3TG63_9BACT|nr:glycosyltransferase family 8 protein [Hymenobacter endophyticus]MDU0370357.1 glycosyltransferase family 8 protein [Hymenobacter endophyticus]
MSKSGSSIHIAIAFDENYLTPVYTLLTSIVENNKQEAIVIHAIVTGLTAEQRQELQQYAVARGSNVHYYDIEESFARDFVLPPTLWWTASIYYRLMFPLVLPAEVQKFIYLDTDIIVLGKLRTLFATDMKGLPVAAVRDFVDMRPELNIHEPDSYFNSGVLLIDRAEWVRRDVTNKVIDFIRNNAEKLVYPDQDALNAVLTSNWLKLDSRFNRMYMEIPKDQPRKQLQEFLQDTVILHYTTQHKPWSMLGENRLRDLYFKYLAQVPKKYRRRYDDFEWNRHKVRKMIEIRLGELAIDYPAMITRWLKK